MDAKELLRRYLEQRRDMGESELVLDGLSVDEVMRIVGAADGGKGRSADRSAADGSGAPVSAPVPGPEAGAPTPAELGREMLPPELDTGDWRAALREAGGVPKPAAGGRGRSEGAPRNTSPAAERKVSEEPAGSGAAAVSPKGTTGAAPAGGAGAGAPAIPGGLVVGGGAGELFGGPFDELKTLDEVATAVRQCTRCDLYRTAKHAVPGDGNPKAELVLVGEAPGANEDETGRPFVGQAGQLLTKILAAINLRREDVFITNVLKHRPPGNRNPLPEEITACKPYLLRQLDIIRPKVIVALGTFAAQTLLDTKLPIGKLRGSVHHYHGIPLVVTYHPAALLRNPSWKRPTWEDVQLARRILDNASSRGP